MSQHTKGPWRWEFNKKHKNVHLVGGVPKYDLTVMDFERWGMGGAVPRFRDTFETGMNSMHRLCDKADWVQPFPNRDHHAHWCAAVIHPDARLIAAAPELLEALKRLLNADHDEYLTPQGVRNFAKAAIAKAEGESIT